MFEALAKKYFRLMSVLGQSGSIASEAQCSIGKVATSGFDLRFAVYRKGIHFLPFTALTYLLSDDTFCKFYYSLHKRQFLNTKHMWHAIHIVTYSGCGLKNSRFLLLLIWQTKNFEPTFYTDLPNF
jgi:hypothetical protein